MISVAPLYASRCDLCLRWPRGVVLTQFSQPRLRDDRAQLRITGGRLARWGREQNSERPAVAAGRLTYPPCAALISSEVRRERPSA
jgi:hypothetical protein